MANPSPAADLTLDPADYFAANAALYGLKVNRLSRWLPIDSRDRALAQWANLIDDFMLEAQALLYLQRTGSGSPQNAIAAPPGTVYLNTEATPTGSRLWIKATGSGTSGWSQVGLPGVGEVTLDLLEDAPAVSVLARAGNTSGARADLASGGSRRALMSDATNAAIAFRALVAADLSFLSSFGASLIDDADAATARGTLGLAAIAASGNASDLSTGTLPAARFDDTAHGSRAGGSLHADVVASGASGFMTGADKAKLDGIAAGAVGDSSVLYALDFTAQGNNTLTGTETIDSRDWIVINEGSSTTFALGATGLHWDASASNTAWSGSFTTATRMQITWAELLGSLFDPMGEYVIDLRMGAYTLGVANNAFWFGMISNGITNAQMAGVRIHNAGGTVGVSFQGTTTTTQIAVQPDVLSLRVSAFRVDGYYGTWSGGWPAASAMTYIGSGAPAPPGSAGNASYFQNGGTSGNESSLVLAAQTGETGGTMDVLVRQLQVRRIR